MDDPVSLTKPDSGMERSVLGAFSFIVDFSGEGLFCLQPRTHGVEAVSYTHLAENHGAISPMIFACRLAYANPFGIFGGGLSVS